MKLNVLNIEGKSLDALDSEFGFDVSVDNSEHLNYLVDKYQKAYLREGNASAKGRGEVRGGGAKPYNQKGTGRARRGTNRTPLRRGGSVIFGPKPRSFKLNLNKKSFKQAYKHALTSRKEDVLILNTEGLKIGTKKMQSFIDTFKGTDKSRYVFIVNDEDYSLYLSIRNLSTVIVCGNAFVPLEDLYRAEKIIFTNDSYKLFEEVHLR
jgi:large subunit ribosomal protein L4